MRRIAFFALLLLATSIPIEDIFELPGVGTPARLLGLLTIALTGLAVLGARRMRPPAQHVVAAYLFTLWVTASMFWSADPTGSADRIITVAQLFAMLLVVHELCASERDVDALLQALVAGSFLAALSVGQSFVLGIEAYYGRFSVPGADPNFTAVSLALVIPIAWYLAARTRHRWLRRLNLAYLVVGTGAIALTGSRAGFLSLLIAMAAVMAQAWRGGPRDRRHLLVLVAIAGLLVATVVPDFIFERIALLDEEVGSADLNGRVQLWRESVAAFSDRPVQGAGAGATREVLPTGKVAHNLLLSVTVEFGLVGVALFLGMAVSAMRGIGRLEQRLRTVLVTVVGILAFGSLSLSLETRKLLWLVVAIVGTATAVAATEHADGHDPAPRRQARADRPASPRSAPTVRRTASP